MKKLLLILMALFLWAGSLLAQVSVYSFASSSGTYTAITGGTVLITGTSAMDSWASAAQTIPAFTFNGVSYTTAYVTSNGFLTLGGVAPSAFTSTAISTTTGSGIAICPFSGDLDRATTTASTDIRWQTVGNEVIFQWTQIKRYAATESFDMQIRLNTTTYDVVFVYQLNSGPGTSTSYQPQVGIRTSTTDYKNRLVASGTENWATSLPGTANTNTCRFTSTAPAKNFTTGLTYTFSPPLPCSGTPDPGNTLSSSNPACSGVNFTLSLQNATPGTGVTYQWQYGPSNTGPWTGFGTNASTATTSQIVATWYQCIVTCSNSGFSGTSNPLQVTMNVASIPYTEGFLTTTTPTCWNIGTWAIGSVRGVTGNPGNNIYKNLYSSATTATFITGNIGPVVAGLLLTFDYKLANYSSPYAPPVAGSGNYIVSVSIDGGGSYTPIETVVNDGTAGWQSKSYPLTAYVGSNIMIRIVGNWVSGDYDLAFDNIKIDAAPACLVPSSLTVSNKTIIGADLGWSSIDSFFDIFIQSTGLPAPGPATTPTVNNYNLGYSYTWTGGAAGLTYDWYVRTDCAAGGGTGQSDWVAGAPFTTLLCNPVDQCNYTFRMTDSYGDGWNGNTMAVKQGAVTVQTISLAGGFGPVNVLVGLCDGVGFELFWNAGGSYPDEVGIEILDAFGTSIYYHAPGTGLQNTSLYTGTVNCTPPACPAPTAQTTSNYTLVGADLGWTSPDSFFDIFIQSNGLPAPGPATTPTVNDYNSGYSYTWTGGTLGNTYDWYVRTDCAAGGGTGQSTWSGPNTFSLNNDVCALAYVINCGDALTGTTVGSTIDVVPACFMIPTSVGVWYKFVGTGDMVSASLCTGTTYDSRISVFEGTCGSLVCVDGNDDYCALVSRVDWFGASGTTYYILIHGYSTNTGPFTLTIDCTSPATATWVGGDGSFGDTNPEMDWFGAANWNAADVPGSTTNVTIPTGLTYYPTVDRKGAANNISVASGARLVDRGAGYLILNGTATVDQNYLGGEWHLISSPVSGATANMFVGLYLQNHTESTNAYTDISNPATLLNVMQGYALWNDLAGTASFVGALNTGAMGTANNVTRSGLGWNLVGNPYASPIDWDAVTGWTKTNMENATYRHVNNVTWAEYVGGVGANGGTRYIAPNQGFFVRVTSGFTLGTLGMTNDVRTHSTAPFFKDEIADLVRLEVSGHGYTNETVIRFLDLATPEFDGDWDAHKLFGIVPEAPAIYSSENDMMAINSLPATNTVPVGVKAGVPGEFTITATETSEFADVILEDLLTGAITDLKSSSYTFNYDMNLDNRFIVHFKPLAIGEIAADLINIYSSQKDVYVSVPANTKGDIVVYNLMGQEVARTLITDVLNKITLDKSAYYVVKVMSNENLVTEKVFVK